MIRPWTEEDVDATRRILREAWLAAYGAFIPVDDLEGYLEEQYSGVALRTLHRTAGVDGFVAEADGAPASYLRTRHDASTGRFCVASLYVLPAAQGRGLGTALLAAAAEAARKAGADRVWLGVMVPNRRTLDWYRRIGFTFAEREPFRMGRTVVDHLIGHRMV